MGFWSISLKGGKVFPVPPFCEFVAPPCDFIIVKVTAPALDVCSCVVVGLGSYVGALGPMGLYGPIATLWNGGSDQLKYLADQLKLHGCVHFTKGTCVCGFKMSKKWSFGPIRNDARPIVAAGRPCMVGMVLIGPI